MAEKSKPIKKTDDESKQFIIDCLKTDPTRGFDVDSLYFHKNKWIIFEYLKCENDHVTPHTSNPKFYPRNWKKFRCLYSLAKQLDGDLYLVNYSTRDADKDQVRVMKVLSFDYAKIKKYNATYSRGHCEYMKLRTWEMTLEQFSKHLRRLNAGATLPPEL